MSRRTPAKGHGFPPAFRFRHKLHLPQPLGKEQDAGQRPAQVLHPHAGDLPAPLVPVDRPQRLHGLLNGGGNGLLGGSAPIQTDTEGSVGFPVLLQIRTHLCLHTELEGRQKPSAELAHPLPGLFGGHLVDDGQNVLYVDLSNGLVDSIRIHKAAPFRLAEKISHLCGQIL